MPNPTRADAVKMLLEKRTHADLASLYHAGMEVQVNVARGEGQRKDGYSGKSKQTYTDGVQTWFAFRCPKGAWGDPEDNSGMEMTYPLGEHAEAIGMTGWDFAARRSRWVAYDFDGIAGHSERHAKKLSDAELARVREAACGIPWVTVRRSTAGAGLHLYVFFAEPVPTKNHDEHAALGRAVLHLMSAIVGYDFEAKVDVCGGNMWVWARKMPRGASGTTRDSVGLSLVKQAGCALAEVPTNWRQHLKVTKGERKKTLPEFAEGEEATFDELAGQHPRIALDDEHKGLIKWLQENSGWGWWDADHHMLVTHTAHLKRAHADRNMRGVFDTTSPATQPDEQNCFAFPLRNGAWVIRRYTKGCAEHPSWEQDGKGFTKCYFNKEPDLRAAARAAGGVETAQGGFAFREGGMALQAVEALGGTVKMPNAVVARPVRVNPHKDGKRVVIEAEHQQGDQGMEGWYLEKGKWRTVVSAPNVLAAAEGEVGVCDDLVRKAVTEFGLDAGWFVRVDERWNHEPKGHTQLALLSTGRKKGEVDVLMGASVLKPWTIVNRPFQDEYPGDRLWNRSKAKFRYPRSDEQGEFPHWQRIFEHCGRGLDDALATNGWAQANDVKTGADYLKLWLASIFQDPYGPLPYLFFYGNQDCGKSIFHESIDLLITGGIVETNTIFEKDEKFNASLEGAVVCVIEEMDLKKNKKAYERIKNWVTSPKVTIRKLYMDPYELPNTTHWVHTANDFEAVPIFPGDTRITMVSVPDLSPGNMIPKPELIELLRREAPHFLNHLLALEIPRSGSRLRVPVVSTSEKEHLAKGNRTSLEVFLEEHTFHVPGELVEYAEFYEKFTRTLEAHDVNEWSKHRVSKGLPPHHPVGKRGGVSYVANVSWQAPPADKPARPRWVVKDRNLVQLGEQAK